MTDCLEEYIKNCAEKSVPIDDAHSFLPVSLVSRKMADVLDELENRGIIPVTRLQAKVLRSMIEMQRSDADSLGSILYELGLSRASKHRIVKHFDKTGIWSILRDKFGDTAQNNAYTADLEKVIRSIDHRADELLPNFKLIPFSHKILCNKPLLSALEESSIYMARKGVTPTLRKLVQWHRAEEIKVINSRAFTEAACCAAVNSDELNARSAMEVTYRLRTFNLRKAFAKALGASYTSSEKGWKPREEFVRYWISKKQGEGKLYECSGEIRILDSYMPDTDAYRQAFNRHCAFLIPHVAIDKLRTAIDTLVMAKNMERETLATALYSAGFNYKTLHSHLRVIRKCGLLDEIGWLQNHIYTNQKQQKFIISRRQFELLRILPHRRYTSKTLARDYSKRAQEVRELINPLIEVGLLNEIDRIYVFTRRAYSYMHKCAKREAARKPAAKCSQASPLPEISIESVFRV